MVHDDERGGPWLVSACLLGVACRYDGGSRPEPRIQSLARTARVIPVCPEQLGGLPTPRPRHELLAGRVLSELGVDATAMFVRGAEQAMLLATLTGCRRAILKARSPSCGAGQLYDGTFSGTLVDGDGVFAAALRAQGVRIETEESAAAEAAGA